MKTTRSIQKTIIPTVYPENYSKWIIALQHEGKNKVPIYGQMMMKIQERIADVCKTHNKDGLSFSLPQFNKFKVSQVVPVLKTIADEFGLKLSNQKHFSFCVVYLKNIICR